MVDQPRGELPYSFGPYTLVSLLGEGGMALVFRAVREGPMGFRKELAVKLIRIADAPKSQSLVKQLINEARLGGQLRHPNVVDTYEFGTVGDEHYIAMELVNGLTLQALLSGVSQRGARLPTATVLDMGAQLCQGLEYAHTLSSHDGQPLNLIHRDLKPANIIVTMAGQAKIMDFGIARSGASLFTATSTDVTKGTLKYMSPEQLSDPTTMDHRSDLFALGAILFECVTGSQLLEGESAEALMWNLVSGKYEEKLSLVDEALPEIRPIIDRCLHKDRDDRYAHAGLLREDLADLQLEIGEGFGCHELMLLLVAHANGESEELERLQAKIRNRIERIGRDSGWALWITRMDSGPSGAQDELATGILHTQGVLARSITDAGPPTKLGEATVVWQAADAPAGAVAAAPSADAQTNALGGSVGSSDPQAAMVEQASPQAKMPHGALQGAPLMPVPDADGPVVGIGSEVSQSTMEAVLPTHFAVASAGPPPRRPRILLLWSSAVGIVLLLISAGILAVWQPWKASQVRDADRLPATVTLEEAIPSVASEASDTPPFTTTSSSEAAPTSPTEHPVEQTEREVPAEAVEVEEPQEPPAETIEVVVEEPPPQERAEEAAPDVTETLPEPSPQTVTEVRIMINTDPWGTWTLSGDQQGSGECPFIRKLPPGDYRFLLAVPDSGASHTMDVHVEGDEGEIKRCWSFIKDGPC